MSELRCGQARALVVIQAGRSHDGTRREVEALLDECIAPAVEALNAAGFETSGSCCGHGKDVPSVMLADGSEIWWDTAGRAVLNVPGRHAEPSVRNFEMVMTKPRGKLAEVLSGVRVPRCSTMSRPRCGERQAEFARGAMLRSVHYHETRRPPAGEKGGAK